MIIILFIILFLCCWAIVHGGTRDKQPTVDMQPVIDTHPIIFYDDDHDVSGLLDED